MPDLRKELISIYAKKSHIQLVEFGIMLTHHIIEVTHFTPDALIHTAFEVSKKWLNSEVSINDVRQIGFKIHELARRSKDATIQTIYRVIGHALSSAHMKEHAIVASDYAIKVINLLYLDDIEAVKNEREVQIKLINEIK